MMYWTTWTLIPLCATISSLEKLLKQGLTQHGGDIDCLGKEDPPTLQEQQCMHQVHMEQLDHISHVLDQVYMQYTLTGSIPSPMVPPLREALLKFHALMSELSKISDTFGNKSYVQLKSSRDKVERSGTNLDSISSSIAATQLYI